MKRIKDFSADIYFPKFTGVGGISKDIIRFDSSYVVITSTDTELRKIFELGLVFPDLILGASTQGDQYEFKKTYSTDTLSVSNLSELSFTDQKPITKSFSFLLWSKNMQNPRLYIFELTNKEADSKTTTKAFIGKASVTAFGFCSILI